MVLLEAFVLGVDIMYSLPILVSVLFTVNCLYEMLISSHVKAYNSPFLIPVNAKTRNIK